MEYRRPVATDNEQNENRTREKKEGPSSFSRAPVFEQPKRGFTMALLSSREKLRTNFLSPSRLSTYESLFLYT